MLLYRRGSCMMIMMYCRTLVSEGEKSIRVHTELPQYPNGKMSWIYRGGRSEEKREIVGLCLLFCENESQRTSIKFYNKRQLQKKQRQEGYFL